MDASEIARDPDKTINCYACGGDGNWHQWISLSPRNVSVVVHKHIDCPRCQGRGWVLRWRYRRQGMQA